MFVHKDIIIVFLFIFFVNFVILVLLVTDLKKINKFLNNFSGSSLKSGRLFFYKLFEPIAFNINKIIGNYEYKFRNEKVRVFFFEYFYKHFPDPLLIINQHLSIIEIGMFMYEGVDYDFIQGYKGVCQTLFNWLYSVLRCFAIRKCYFAKLLLL